MGAAKSSADQCSHFASAESSFANSSLDLSMFCQFFSVLIFIRDRRRNIKRKSMFSLSTCGELLWTASLRSLYILSILLCLIFCLGCMGAANSSSNHGVHPAPAENCFGQHPLDLSICCQFFSVLIFAWGGWAPQNQTQINVFTLRLRRIAFDNLP